MTANGPFPANCSGPPDTTVWSFPIRGSWATHKGDYPGNWAPQVVRQLLLRYTQPGHLVVDPMVGSGTTIIEALLLGRKSIGTDINPAAVDIAKRRVEGLGALAHEINSANFSLRVADARALNFVEDGAADLFLTHPPYFDMVRYSHGENPADLSSMTLQDFFDGISRLALEAFRVTKDGATCAVMMGDMRRRGVYIPLAARVLERFLQVGFILREDIIKLQWNTTARRQKWSGTRYPFLLIAHEHILVFSKGDGPSSPSRS